MAEPSVKDLAYRTAASVFGGPVDLATMVMRPFGYKTPDEKVFGSSEYIGKKLEDVGLVSSARAPITEFLTSMAVPTPGGLAKGAALTAPQVLSMFVGARSLTWNASAAEKAKMLADIGADARTIWQQTGTWKGPDGKWRQEIDDSQSAFSGLPMKPAPVSASLQHDPLAVAYPNEMQIPAMYSSTLGPGVKAQYGTFHGETGILGAADADKSTMLHELQHAIQQREGFARGGSPSDMRQEALEMLRRDVASGAIGDTAEAMSMLPMAQQNAYRRLAGEAEARATQARMNMTPAQRRAAFPEESYDVPINQLIVR